MVYILQADDLWSHYKNISSSSIFFHKYSNHTEIYNLVLQFWLFIL